MLFGTWSQAHAYDPSDYMDTRLKPGLHISCKDRKHTIMFASRFLKVSSRRENLNSTFSASYI